VTPENTGGKTPEVMLHRLEGGLHHGSTLLFFAGGARAAEPVQVGDRIHGLCLLVRVESKDSVKNDKKHHIATK
jgi:hypothetical protein